MEMSLHEITLVDDPVLHLQPPTPMEPPFFVLSLVPITQPIGSYRHQLYIITLLYTTIQSSYNEQVIIEQRAGWNRCIILGIIIN